MAIKREHHDDVDGDGVDDFFHREIILRNTQQLSSYGGIIIKRAIFLIKKYFARMDSLKSSTA